MFEIEPFTNLFLGLMTGVAFGFLLQKGGVAKYQTILGQLLLRDWTAFKVMLTASAVGAVGVYLLVENGSASLDIWPFQPAAMLLGAVLFGVGIAILGYCPGTGIAGAGEGSRDAWVGVAGMITGAGLLVMGFNVLEPLALSLGDLGKLTIPIVTGTSPWIVITAFVLGAAGVLWLISSHTAALKR
jgi:uncharacterized protein